MWSASCLQGFCDKWHHQIGAWFTYVRLTSFPAACMYLFMNPDDAKFIKWRKRYLRGGRLWYHNELDNSIALITQMYMHVDNNIRNMYMYVGTDFRRFHVSVTSTSGIYCAWEQVAVTPLSDHNSQCNDDVHNTQLMTSFAPENKQNIHVLADVTLPLSDALKSQCSEIL